jgi:hypothetical protein
VLVLLVPPWEAAVFDEEVFEEEEDEELLFAIKAGCFMMASWFSRLVFSVSVSRCRL